MGSVLPGETAADAAVAAAAGAAVPVCAAAAGVVVSAMICSNKGCLHASAACGSS